MSHAIPRHHPVLLSRRCRNFARRFPFRLRRMGLLGKPLPTHCLPARKPAPVSPLDSFATVVAVAERLYGGDWAVLTARAESAPVVGYLHCQSDEETRTYALAKEEGGRLYIAKARTNGQTEDDALTALFEKTAEKIFSGTLERVA